MSGIPLLLGDTASLLYLFPLLLICSVVYGATRHELWGPIQQNSIRTLIWLLSFIGILFGVFLIFSWLI